MHYHTAVRLFYTKENGALAVAKNQGTKIPFRYVFCLANVLKRAWAEPDCLETRKIFLPNSPLLIVKRDYMNAVSSSPSCSVGTLSFTHTGICVLARVNNNRGDVD